MSHIWSDLAQENGFVVLFFRKQSVWVPCGQITWVDVEAYLQNNMDNTCLYWRTSVNKSSSSSIQWLWQIPWIDTSFLQSSAWILLNISNTTLELQRTNKSSQLIILGYKLFFSLTTWIFFAINITTWEAYKRLTSSIDTNYKCSLQSRDLLIIGNVHVTWELHRTRQKFSIVLTLEVLVSTIDAQWEGIGDVGSARYEPALLPPCPTKRVLSYSN